MLIYGENIAIITLTKMLPTPLLLASGSLLDHITLIGLSKTKL